MKSARRIAIVDRSVLANNIYQLLLKPLGFSLISYNTLKSLKESLDEKGAPHILLINSNVFGKNFADDLEWFKKGERVKGMEKIFLCHTDEKKIADQLKKVPHSRVVSKPFYPSQLGEALEKLA